MPITGHQYGTTGIVVVADGPSFVLTKATIVDGDTVVVQYAVDPAAFSALRRSSARFAVSYKILSKNL